MTDTRRFAIVPQAAAATDLPGQALRVLIAICTFAGPDGRAWPGMTELSRRTGIPRKKIPALVRRLETAGIVGVDRDPGANQYEVSFSGPLLALPSVPQVGDRGCSPVEEQGVPQEGSEVSPRRGTKQTRTDQLTDNTIMLALPAPAPIVADPPSPKRSAKGTTAEVEDGFAKFWQRYPRKVGKGQARRAFAAALMKTTLPDLLAGVDRLNAHHAAVKTEQRFIPHPSTWLNGERWSDDLAGSSVSAPVPTEDPATRQWRARLASYRERGLWLDAYGPRPGEPRCEAPKQILAEMGLAA